MAMSKCVYMRDDGRCYARGCRHMRYEREWGAPEGRRKKWRVVCGRDNTQPHEDGRPDLCSHPAEEDA